MNQPRYISHSDLNKVMWDKCVTNAPNGLIYAQSAYLDAMSPGWAALVYKDYEAIMPLTHKRKAGISYLAQPLFSQQLGIISPLKLKEALIHDFLDQASKKFSFIEINLNFLNPYPGSQTKCNLIIDLAPSFDMIKRNFRKDLLTSSLGSHLIIEKGEDYEEVIQFFRENYPGKIPHIKNADFKNFSKICRQLLAKSGLFVRKVITKEEGILACAVFFKDEKRIYYMLSATNPAGRKYNATAFLLFEVIKEFSGSSYIFDFEGSSIPSIQFFFKKFGPIEQSYPSVRINNLPGIFKVLKN